MAHIGLSYDFDLEISQALFWVFKSVKSARFTALSNAWVTARNSDWVTAPKGWGSAPGCRVFEACFLRDKMKEIAFFLLISRNI